LKPPETDLSIRTAGSDDVPAVDALLRRAYPRLLAADYPPSLLVTAIPRISRAQPALVTCGTYYLAETGGRLVGAGGWTPGRRDRGRANVRHLVTDDRAVRQGVGRALMGHIFGTAREAGARWMHTTSTLTAVPFYKALGFTEIGPAVVTLDAGIEFPVVELRRDL